MSGPLPSILVQPNLVAINAALIAVRQAAAVLCDRATLLVLLHAHSGACRYAEFGERTGLASRLVSSRLARLTDDGLLVRIPYSRRPLRHAYHLTHMGVALFDVLALLATWEQAWPDGADTDTLVSVEHLGCGAALAAPQLPASALSNSVRLKCAGCQEAITAQSISLLVHQKEMAQMPTKSTAMRRTRQDPAAPAEGAIRGPLPQGLSVLGDKWSIEVLVCSFFGLRQFGDFGTRLGISTNILTDRLSRLVAEGLLRRSDADEPLRKGLYLLTDKGRDFYAILIAIQVWADQWIDHRVRSPVKLRHIPCQKLLQPVLTCVACGQVVTHAQGRIAVTART